MYFLPRSSSLNTAGSAEEAIRIRVISLLRSAPVSGTSGYREKLLMYACRGENKGEVTQDAANNKPNMVTHLPARSLSN